MAGRVSIVEDLLLVSTRLTLVIFAWSLAAASSSAQDATGRTAWRGRDVAGREIDVECDVREISGVAGGGGDLSEWQERIRDVVVAKDEAGARGIRITTRVARDAVDPRIAVDFFDVDRKGVLQPVRSFGSGARRYTKRLVTATSGLGWSRTLPLRKSSVDSIQRREVAQEKEDGPPQLFAILPSQLEWTVDPKPAPDGGLELGLAPVVALPIDIGEPPRRTTLLALKWAARLDADRVLVGEEREIEVTFDWSGASECDRFAWRETRVVQIEAAGLDRLREEGDALREAYRTMNARPEAALVRLDAVERMTAPRAFDDVAAALRDYASHRKEWIELSIMRAVVGAIEKLEGTEASNDLVPATSLDALLAGRSLEKPDARELFESGRMIRWVEANEAARAVLSAAVVGAAKRRLVLDESDVGLAEALIAAGIDDEDGDRQRELAGTPPPDADEIRKRIDAAIAGAGK
jgi:hypothetical protein